MRRLLRIVLVICVGSVIGWGVVAGLPTVRAQEQSAVEQMGVREADTWLGLVDSGQYAESWDAAAAVFKSAVTVEKWKSAMKQARDPLGKMQSRIVQSATHTTVLPGVPDGDYVVLLYESSFENKKLAQETVILSREKDKVLRVAGYYIK
jgi:Protein of unknown function (DUF4019)